MAWSKFKKYSKSNPAEGFCWCRVVFLPQTQLLCLPKGLVASSGQAHYDPQNSAFSSKGDLLQKRKS